MWEKLKGQNTSPGVVIAILRKLAPTVIGCCLAIWLIRKVWHRHTLNQKLANKRQQLKLSKDRLRQQLYKTSLSLADREHILSLNLKELQAKLQNGELKAVNVLTAYQSRALEVDEQINCVVEPVHEAEQIAKALDAQTEPKKPLHGIPFSVKDNIYLKGYNSAGGMEMYIGRLSEEDATVIEALKQLGAVPFMRTTVPQAMMSYCCSSPLLGRTSNPLDHSRSPGGSSGGEAALLAGHGSIIGVGTDIGGSVRVPANACGLCSLKPTRGRFNTGGVLTVNPGQTLVQSTIGLMAHDVEGLASVAQSLMGPELFALDAQIMPVPFRREVYEAKQPLKIGFYTWDGCVRPVPAVIRAVQVAKTALEKMGHTVVPFSPLDSKGGYLSLFLGSMGGDAGQTVKEQLAKDDKEESLRLTLNSTKLPKWLLSLIIKIVERKDHVLAAALINVHGFSSVYHWFKHAVKVQKYKSAFEQHWRKAGLDGVICPVYPCPAVPSNIAPKLTVGGSYCCLYNLLRYSAGSVTVTKVTESDVKNTMNPEIYPATTILEGFVKKACVGSEGLPVGVQCVCLPYHEEHVLRILKDIETGLNL